MAVWPATVWLAGWLSGATALRGVGVGEWVGGGVHSGVSIAGCRPTVSDLGLDPAQLDRLCVCVK